MGSEYLVAGLRIATVMVPVALYFLIVGLLNSRRRPQLLTGRRDFALLVVALSPLFALPALSYFGVTLRTVAVAAGCVAAVVWLLAPRGKTWVIYNLLPSEAAEIAAHVLRDAGVHFTPTRHGFEIPAGGSVELSAFRMLRNVTVRLRGGDETLARRFEAGLEREVSAVRVETAPMAVAMLLVAVAMMVTPLTLVAHRADEIVRLLTDLLP